MMKNNNSYSVILCDTDKSKEINYFIRYQVYCLEAGFEEANNYPARIEVDRYDKFSTHFLIRDHNTDSWIGACRVIALPFSELPILQHCDEENIKGFDKNSATAEISRLCILTSSRKGTREIVTLLLKAAIQYCLNQNIQQCFSINTKALARVIKTLNVQTQEISEDFEHHGLRRAYYHNISSFEATIENNNNPSKYTTNNIYQLFSEYKKQGLIFS